MAAKKTAKKASESTAAKQAPAAPAAKKTAKKAAKKAAVAKSEAAPAPAKTAGAPAPKISSDAIARAAYLNYRRRVELGLPGDSRSDWLEAERQLGKA